ncbi:MAG: SDR family oxidoreductase [Gemmatimonadota bacterium]|nr:SDR family oxidoreductase [Gemmatimonadota bacterium]
MVVTVTGSTGTIGSELVQLLSDGGAPIRAVFRSASRVRPLPSVVWLQADLHDTRVLEPTLAGTTRLFLLSGNEPGFGKLQIDTVRAAQDLGVAHVVKLSALGASSHSNSTIAREHWEVEQALQRTTMTWTILRPHAFMQNWLGEVAESVRAEGVIYSPIGDGRVPFIDTRDIAAVAAEALLHPEAHAGLKYFLTGGEAVGYDDLAATLSQATGKAVTYRPISMDEARARMEARGTSAAMIEAMLAISAYQKAGGPTAKVSDSVERILGRAPRTIRDFVRDYARHFETAE